jgi:hypothetical protein
VPEGLTCLISKICQPEPLILALNCEIGHGFELDLAEGEHSCASQRSMACWNLRRSKVSTTIQDFRASEINASIMDGYCCYEKVLWQYKRLALSIHYPLSSFFLARGHGTFVFGKMSLSAVRQTRAASLAGQSIRLEYDPATQKV